MAKKQITASSSPAEIKIANEQLTKAYQEYNDALNALKNEQGIPVVPSTGKPLTAQQQVNLARNITSKYEYVDYGQLPSSNNEINIGGDKFFVKGLNGSSKTTFAPEAKTTVNSDDAFPITKPATAPTLNLDPKTNNPNQTKLDQSIINETSPVTATESKQVSPAPTENKIGNKDATQAGAALENNKRQSSQTQNGIVNQNQNELPTTNNLPGRLSDEYVKDPIVKKSNVDDAATPKAMGTAITGFGNNDVVNSFPDKGRTTNDGAITSGTNNSIPTSSSSKGTRNNPSISITPNVLHNYANWTYKIGLYMLDVANYNAIIGGSAPSDNGKYPIAVSGGYKRGQGTAIDLEGDVYIDSLRFTSIIGNRQSGAATNNLDLEMQLVEPYGASLIGELAILAKEIKPEVNLSEIPYLLEIDFMGYKDDGRPVDSILKETGRKKKVIPVKILSIDMKLESAGARYTLQMVPYNLFAYTNRYGNIPKDLWTYGETVTDICGAGVNGLIGGLNAIEKQKVEKDKTQEFPDVYAIKFYSFNKAGTNTKEMETSKVAYPVQAGPATITHNRMMTENVVTKQGYTVKAGTVIKEAIKDLVMGSEYFNLKMKPNEPNSSKDPAELIKIIPVIKLQDKWDNIRNEFPKEITFHVTNTLLFGEIFAYAGQAPLEDWGYSKEYNYIFTGKNNDITNLDIEFNLLYYQNFFPDFVENSLMKTNAKATGEKAPANSASNQGIAAPSIKAGAIASYAPSQPARYINSQLAAEFFDLKMNNSNADLIELNMTIIGDPDWIPQDASVRGGEISIADKSELKDKNGSIAIDVAGVYVKLQLRTPRDYNDTTGLMDLAQDKSLVGGVYQVISVENQFQSGKFSSVLNMVKVPKQEENYLQNRNRDRQN